MMTTENDVILEVVWHGGLVQTGPRYTSTVKGELLPAYHSTARREEINALHERDRQLAHKREYARARVKARRAA